MDASQKCQNLRKLYAKEIMGILEILRLHTDKTHDIPNIQFKIIKIIN